MTRARRGGLLLVVAGSTLALGLSTRAAPPPDESPLGYIEMPPSEDGTWVLTSPPGSGRNWGQPVFIRHLVLVAREWKRRHPEGPFLRLGDLSKPDGSDFPPHKTHKDGLTADVFTSPKNICHINFDDQDLTLELAQLFHDYGARQILYNGAKVVETVPVASRWPQHDDHFHVVIDPARVPPEGELLVLPETRSRDGAVVPATGLAEDRTGLELGWRVLGQAKLKSWRVLFDDAKDDGPPLHDSGPQKNGKTRYALPVPIEHGASYRWKVELDVGGDAPAGFGWQRLRADLVAPTVAAVGPNEGAEVDDPVLVWSYQKAGGVAQAAFRIELDGDANHKKISATLGPFPGAVTRYALAGVPLKRGKKYHWRVIAIDAHGNEGASEWRSFELVRAGAATSGGTPPSGGSGSGGSGGGERPPPRQPEPEARTGTVTADSLNLRSGPGTEHGILLTLRRGTPLKIIADRGDWLEVETAGASGPVKGFVSKQYVDTSDE